MNQITRRNLLQSLTAAPLVSMLSPLEAALAQSRPTPELFLWFHGLFAFVMMRDYIAVLTPKVKEHSFLAGLWKQEQQLREGEWYRLSGVSNAARPDPLPELKRDKMMVLSGAKAVNMAESFCLIRLPFPKEIIPLRFARAQFSGEKAPKQSATSTFPTVLILKYRVVDYSNLRLEPFKGWVTQKRPPERINFHIFAEPGYLPHAEHSMEAFEGMIKLFPGIDLKLTESSSKCFPIDTNVPPGIDPQLQIGLAERNGACKKPPSIRTGDCFMIIIEPGP